MGIHLALGDSISIDEYTGVSGGGASSQLARKLGVDLVDLTRDGNTTQGVLADLSRAPAAADLATLTAGGNDLLGGELPRAILRRLDQIAAWIQPLGDRVVLNTIYDPGDGCDASSRYLDGYVVAARFSRSSSSSHSRIYRVASTER
jgi:lysophospholipase L1-like esterase